jgi:hypothetical protein
MQVSARTVSKNVEWRSSPPCRTRSSHGSRILPPTSSRSHDQQASSEPTTSRLPGSSIVTYIRRVTAEVAEQVMERDAREIYLNSEEFLRHGMSERRFWTKRIICIAPMLDPAQSGRCWGRSTLDHVKDQLRMGVRATSDPDHLATICEGHTETGRQAGYQWNTEARNRRLVREYLQRHAAKSGRGASEDG